MPTLGRFLSPTAFVAFLPPFTKKSLLLQTTLLQITLQPNQRHEFERGLGLFVVSSFSLRAGEGSNKKQLGANRRVWAKDEGLSALEGGLVRRSNFAHTHTPPFTWADVAFRSFWEERVSLEEGLDA